MFMARSFRERGGSACAPSDVIQELPGDWRLLGRIGGGDWADVYRAQPLTSEHGQPGDYAVKMAKPDAADSALALNMLRREVALGAALDDSHLPAVLDAHLKEPPYFFVTPYLPGATLGEVVAGGKPFSASFALWIGRQAAQALAAIHGIGWRHGDVKPHNLLVSPEGHLTLIDLGLASPTGESLPGSETSLAGTLAYTAPECFCAARKPDGKSDVYSLGAALFELLAGAPPFTANDAEELASAHLCTPPPDIRQRAPRVDGRVARLLKRMLAKDPLRRPSAAEVVDLAAALEIETLADRIPV